MLGRIHEEQSIRNSQLSWNPRSTGVFSKPVLTEHLTKMVTIMLCQVKLNKQILAFRCHFLSAAFTSVNVSIRWQHIECFIQWWSQRGRVSLSGAYEEQPKSLEIWVTRRRGWIERSETAEILRGWFVHLSPWLNRQSLHTVGTATFFSGLPLTIKEASRMQNSDAVVKIQLRNRGRFRRLECFSHRAI